MIGVESRVAVDADGQAAVDDAVDAYLMDVAASGFNAAHQLIEAEATDTGQLLRSGVQPERQPDGSVMWGFGADYAEYVDQGSAPHWAPIEPLLGWARRVIGDESAAYAVQQKIAEEGTEGVHFVKAGIDAMRAYASAHDFEDYVVKRL